MISENLEIAEICNDFIVIAAMTFDIGVSDEYITDAQHINDPILKAIKKYAKHPSIIKRADNISINNKFSFSTVPINIKGVVNSLDVSKSTTYCNIQRYSRKVLTFVPELLLIFIIIAQSYLIPH